MPISQSSAADVSVVGAALPLRTRLAPSPTGALHLGNARTFLINWLMARQLGWRIVLRIDDLDGPRVKKGADRDAIEMLEWLGLDWDEGPFYQSACLDTYKSALQELAASGAIYPCRCTRTQIQQATLSAPHAGDHELRYPGTCRPASRVSCVEAWQRAVLEDQPPAWRLRVARGEQTFHDELWGDQRTNVAQEVGDFLVATKQGLPSYQLAVVVDDASQQVNCIVRGADLLASTARQLLIKQALGISANCRYWHLPLIIGEDGRRLAKRHGDTRVAHYREQGVSAERVLGLLAEWSGIGERRELTLSELAERFDLQALPRQPIVFHAHDDAWLRSGE